MNKRKGIVGAVGYKRRGLCSAQMDRIYLRSERYAKWEKFEGLLN